MRCRPALRFPVLALAAAFCLLAAGCGSDSLAAIESGEVSDRSQTSTSETSSPTNEAGADEDEAGQTADGDDEDPEDSNSSDTDTDSNSDDTNTDADADAETDSGATVEAMICQYDPDKGGPNPFGMRTFLRFEDRALGGSALVFESFGNAVGDGSFWWQSVFPSETAISLYADVLDGDLPIEELFGADGASRAEIEAVFSCSPVDGPTPAYDDYERPEIPTTGTRCLFDPALGENQIGPRAALSVYEIDDGNTAIGSGVLFETFGNAAGDGAGYHLDVFLDLDPQEALDAYLSDPAYYNQSIGYPEETEIADLIDQIKLSHPCTSS